jgi:tetratricopeptide (TPR) repeat protein
MWRGKGWKALQYDKTAEEDLRRMLDIHPQSARAHLKLGIYLGLNSNIPEEINEGLSQCKEAVKLKPEWEAPHIEIASILVKFGRYEVAIQELEAASHTLPQMTARFAYTLGFVKMICNDFAGAVQMYETAIQQKPDYALAYDNAAHCCFLLKDTIKGKRYAKQAYNLGESLTYNAWYSHLYEQQPLPQAMTQRPFWWLDIHV